MSQDAFDKAAAAAHLFERKAPAHFIVLTLNVILIVVSIDNLCYITNHSPKPDPVGKYLVSVHLHLTRP